MIDSRTCRILNPEYECHTRSCDRDAEVIAPQVEKTIYSADYRRLCRMLNARRVFLGFKQADLAEWLGVSRTLVSNCENGERRIDLIELDQIHAALELDLVQFVAEFKIGLRSVLVKLGVTSLVFGLLLHTIRQLLIRFTDDPGPPDPRAKWFDRRDAEVCRQTVDAGPAATAAVMLGIALLIVGLTVQLVT